MEAVDLYISPGDRPRSPAPCRRACGSAPPSRSPRAHGGGLARISRFDEGYILSWRDRPMGPIGLVPISHASNSPGYAAHAKEAPFRPSRHRLRCRDKAPRTAVNRCFKPRRVVSAPAHMSRKSPLAVFVWRKLNRIAFNSDRLRLPTRGPRDPSPHRIAPARKRGCLPMPPTSAASDRRQTWGNRPIPQRWRTSARPGSDGDYA